MVRAAALVIAGALACVLGLEALFHVLPVSTYTDVGYHIDPRILTYRPGHAFRLSWGWNLENPLRQQANNLGFLSERDFTPDPRALGLIGDSFVDASMLPRGERVGDQVQKVLGARPVYAMGGPGSSLLDYAERMRYASEKLAVRDFVIVLETGDIKQVYCGSGNIHAPCLDRKTGEARVETQPPPSSLKLVLRHSAFLQYMLGHLRFDPAARLARAFAAPPASRPTGGRSYWTGMTEGDIDRIVGEFFERVAPYRKGRLMFVLDSDRLAMNRGDATPDPLREHLMDALRSRGAEVLDLAPVFARYVEETGYHLEISPHDGHWNARATRLVAEAVATALARQ
jgi:hypothetical protein